MDQIPTLSVALIEELEKDYPARSPSLKDSDREIWFKAGQRSVVDNLKNMLKQQEEEDAEHVFRT